MHLRRHRHLQEENKWVQFEIQKIPHGIEKVKYFQTKNKISNLHFSNFFH